MDPRPASPAWMRSLTMPLAEKLHLYTFPMHVHEVLAAALFYGAVKRAAPALSRRLSPSIYPQLDARTRLSWDVHVVSLVQSVTINALAIHLMISDHDARAKTTPTDRVWAYDSGGALIQSFAAGYFLWDLVITALNVNVFGVGMLAHAVCALSVYGFGFRPFVNFYAPGFILYELSSPFLNIHWFLDKINMTGSRLQWYNGMILLVTFFGCRLIWGSWLSFCVFRDIYSAARLIALPALPVGDTIAEALTKNPRSIPEAIAAAESGDPLSFARLVGIDATVPLWIQSVYLASNIVLNFLNWFWFGRMIETVRKRFREPREDAKKKVPETRPRSNSVAARVASGFDDFAENMDHARRRFVAGEMGPAGAGDEWDMQ